MFIDFRGSTALSWRHRCMLKRKGVSCSLFGYQISVYFYFFPDTMSEQLFPAAAKKPANRCNRLRPLFNLCQLCGGFWFDAIHYTPTPTPPTRPGRVPGWLPPHERSLAHFSFLGRGKTSEVVRAFPVERSQQPHDLINGDKHKPALTSTALRSNKDTAQLLLSKLLLWGPARVHAGACIGFFLSLLWSFPNLTAFGALMKP